MLDASERHGWVEAIKELKSQYYVGSQDAFRYLKAMRWYEKVREEILNANPVLAQKFDLSVQMVAWLVFAIRDQLAPILDFAATKVSSPRSLSLTSVHQVNAPVALHPLEENVTEHIWTINFSDWIGRFLAHLPHLADRIDTSNRLHRRLKRQFYSGVLHPIYVSTGEAVSYQRFCEDVIFRKGDKDIFWYMVEDYLSSKDAHTKLLKGDRRILRLRSAFLKRNLVTAHHIMQREEINDKKNVESVQLFVEHIMPGSSAALRSDGYLYLYGFDDLYRRAEREYTLGLIEVERRILLSYVYQYQGEDGRIDSPLTFVNMLFNRCRLDINSGQHTVDDLRRYGGHYRSRLISSEHHLQKNRYLLRALHQNKKWLIEFLSH